jgi:hypothetical protein
MVRGLLGKELRHDVLQGPLTVYGRSSNAALMDPADRPQIVPTTDASEHAQ